MRNYKAEKEHNKSSIKSTFEGRSGNSRDGLLAGVKNEYRFPDLNTMMDDLLLNEAENGIYQRKQSKF